MVSDLRYVNVLLFLDSLMHEEAISIESELVYNEKRLSINIQQII